MDVCILFSKSHNTRARGHSVKLVDHLKSDKKEFIYSAHSELWNLLPEEGQNAGSASRPPEKD